MARKYQVRHKRKGKYKSLLEVSVARRLGRKAKYEVDKLEYTVPAKTRKYSPDFTILKADGNKLYIEVKGFLRYEDQMKMRWVKESNPDADIRFYFPKSQKIHMSKKTNVEWCEQYGFPYYIGELPKDL